MTARSLQYLQVFLLFCWMGASILLWPSLPEKLPVHFGASGAPDAWADRSLFSWFGLPMIGLAMVLLMYALSRIRVGGSLDLWNIPEKDRFLRLTPDQQAPLVERLRRVPLLCGVLTTVMFMALHVGVYQAATGRSSGLPWYSMVVIGVSIVGILAMSIRATQKFGEEVRRA
ncbi:MAG TPA: DUF1648 domain-containing protein [Gemmatimonadales bacterium]|nr:DUF1648 domain-containing protein [Gemmatimonadales bacterium]